MCTSNLGALHIVAPGIVSQSACERTSAIRTIRTIPTTNEQRTALTRGFIPRGASTPPAKVCYQSAACEDSSSLSPPPCEGNVLLRGLFRRDMHISSRQFLTIGARRSDVVAGTKSSGAGLPMSAYGPISCGRWTARRRPNPLVNDVWSPSAGIPANFFISAAPARNPADAADTRWALRRGDVMNRPYEEHRWDVGA